MTLGRFSKIALALFILFVLTVGLTSINHPIILKWVTGSARHLGKPIPAKVYTNGQANDRVNVFYTDESNTYLLSFTGYDSLGRLRFLHLDLEEKWIGIPAGTSKYDYDFIAGHLFQSEVGGKFSPLQDDMKGLSFEPQLSLTDRTIKFNLPSHKLNFDSVRIILP